MLGIVQVSNLYLLYKVMWPNIDLGMCSYGCEVLSLIIYIERISVANQFDVMAIVWIFEGMSNIQWYDDSPGVAGMLDFDIHFQGHGEMVRIPW